MDDLEGNGTRPVYIITGDFNWDTAEVTDLKEGVKNRRRAGLATASDKEQALILCDVMERSFLSQCMTEKTRMNNLLDLLLVSDISVIKDIEYIVNVKLSDHTTNVCELNMSKHVTKSKSQSFASTVIGDYDMIGSSAEDWENLK